MRLAVDMEKTFDKIEYYIYMSCCNTSLKLELKPLEANEIVVYRVNFKHLLK